MIAPLRRFLVLAAACLMCSARAQSFYPERLADPSAVYFTPDRSGDDTAALQRAIDTVADTARQGIVFLPPGRYVVTHTLYVWPGVRIIGYGPQRPVLALPAQTPGYQTGPAYLVVFTGGRPGGRRRGGDGIFPGSVPAKAGVIDANPGTFYSAMSNLDFEIGDGNPGAVAIRFHVAQHCFLSHMNFEIGSGLAALQDIGNEAEDLRFHGGQYGIMTGRPSPGWQFTLLDSTFAGQRIAAILEHEAGLALIHDTFRDVPAAIDIEAHHIEELWMQDCRFERIPGPAVTISEEFSRLTEINFQNVVCQAVPIFAKLRDSGQSFSGQGNVYRINTFLHGLSVQPIGGADSPIVSQADVVPLTAFPPETVPAILPPPAPTGWANARALGAIGDGVADDTAALQRIVDAHRIVYLPSGRYRLTDTLRLRPDSVLIGLHPSTTQLDLGDDTPGFTGAGDPKPLLLAPPGGPTQVRGIGLWTGGSNNLAAAAIWRAGKDSLMDDVRFLGGHGTNNPDGTRMNPYNSSHGGDPNPLYRWDAQYPSLWVRDGGGGTFADIWTPDTFAQAGLYISDTATAGRVYELSSEHHVRNEVKLERAANWELVALQTEEERGEGGGCLPLAIQDCRHLTIAEMHAYRVVSSFTPFSAAIHVNHSDDIRFRNLHIYSDSKAVFDSSVEDDDSGVNIRELEMAALTLSAGRPRSAIGSPSGSPPLERLATGFFNASSPTCDRSGRLCFVDPVRQRIYRYDPAARRLEILSDHPIDPANLFFDEAGNLMVVSYQGKGTVYALSPDHPAAPLQILRPRKAAPGLAATPVLALDHWRFDRERVLDIGSVPAPWQYLSPDGTRVLPAGDDFVTGALYYGTKMADVLRAFALRAAPVGQTFYVTDEGQNNTYAGTVGADGALHNVHLFLHRGGEGVAVAPDGSIYLAAGQIYVYTPAGQLLKEIDVPERPTALIFGGPTGNTLFILARTSLYSAQ